MTEDTDRRITVRYRRLEATAQYCSVEFEAIASIPLGEAESIPMAIGLLRKDLETEVSRAVVEAKRCRAAEEAAPRQASAAGLIPARPVDRRPAVTPKEGLPF